MGGSRPRIVGLLMSLVVLGGSLTACGSGDETTGAAESSEEPGARQLIAGSTLRGVHSGALEGRFTLDNETREEAVQWRVYGPFTDLAEGSSPEMNLHLETQGVLDGKVMESRESLQMADGLRLLRRNGSSYDPGRSFSQAGRHWTEECRQALEGVRIMPWLKDLTSEPVPGFRTVMVKGEFDVPGALQGLQQISRIPACGSVLAAAGVPMKDLMTLLRTVKTTFTKTEATFRIWRGHILTEIGLGLWVRPPGSDAEEVDGRMSLVLSRPNQIGRIHVQKKTGLHIQKIDKREGKELEARAALVMALLGSLGAS